MKLGWRSLPLIVLFVALILGLSHFFSDRRTEALIFLGVAAAAALVFYLSRPRAKPRAIG